MTLTLQSLGLTAFTLLVFTATIWLRTDELWWVELARMGGFS